MIKEILYKIFYFFEWIFSTLFFSKQKKSLIVIRTDAIGDYILFRNFLASLYEQYGKFTLVGNIAFQNLAEQLDNEFIDEFIPINRRLFARNLLYRFKLIKRIRTTSYQTLINPIYSRDRISEDIAKIINAQEKIASQGDLSNLPPTLKKKYDKNYSLLIPDTDEILFEFYRNLNFFKTLIKPNIQVDFYMRLQDLKKNLSQYSLSTPYSVIFIGASDQFRKWGLDNFVEIGKFLNLNFKNHIVICGGEEDMQGGKYIQEKLASCGIQSTNLCGKTSLIDLALILNNTDFLISNETSAVHIAMALHCSKVFVISNGNHFHRFSPYPQELRGNHYHLILHPSIQNCVDQSSFAGKNSTLDINDIDASMLIDKILKKYPIANDTHKEFSC
ncbi:lipopolysaccharide heptosyltransferase family protein [Helicobacter cholecystus]|uniref:Lipopolysaccharide heptosyltransferase family protein n=1 Tax=Helicobacter cholecystus TaxID=45498 RepID=A0A3D8ITV9_9HELI|nr:glycosyltransferase family 9 protein [Helicobacter cholecystus]RDU68652.1 lipopolysaccharide heptosyltransferase family protein [Helicobacter cholecystus]VEJ24445.1 ADP-heptose:LPS heptosyltransferase [Helicobacter cholecystus]